MKIGNPYDKESLSLKHSFKVLEIGPGNNPTRRSNTLIEKFVEDNLHRSGDLKIFSHQKLIEADGEDLPVGNKEYDYIICSHVIEHVENPEKFVRELSRVANMGYIETPSLIGEFLAPKVSHKWVVLEIDEKLVFYEKSRLPYNFEPDYGNVFLNYLPNQSLPLRLLILSRANLTAVRYEWKDSIEIIINPEDDYLTSFFTKNWTPEMARKIFPPNSASKELIIVIKALTRFTIDKISAILDIRKGPLSLKEYRTKFPSLGDK